MEDIRPNSVACFDNQYTNNHIRKIKVLLHFLAPSMQPKLAVYIKFMELQYTLRFSGAFPVPETSLSGSATDYSDKIPDLDMLWEELLPYCEPDEKQQFTQFRNTFQTLQNLQNMMEMMETLKELFPDGMVNSEGQGGFNPEMMTAMSSMFGGGGMDFGAMAETFSNN